MAEAVPSIRPFVGRIVAAVVVIDGTGVLCDKGGAEYCWPV